MPNIAGIEKKLAPFFREAIAFRALHAETTRFFDGFIEYLTKDGGDARVVHEERTTSIDGAIAKLGPVPIAATEVSFGIDVYDKERVLTVVTFKLAQKTRINKEITDFGIWLEDGMIEPMVTTVDIYTAVSNWITEKIQHGVTPTDYAGT